MKEVHFYVSGRVQGVGYRAWCVRQAKSFGLSGWVRNRRDGTVEILAKGEDSAITLFIKSCKKGPLWANVIALTPVMLADAYLPIVEDGLFVQKPTV